MGGIRKGFHLAALDVDSAVFLRLGAADSPDEAVRWIGALPAKPEIVAIDAPPFALRTREETRAAERAVCRAGYRIQWTRKFPKEPAEWMVNGASLWRSLERYRCVETFPTVVHNQLIHSCEQLPLNLLVGFDRNYYKDFVDACLAAFAARRVLDETALCFGLDDEFGPIWC